MNSPAPDMTIKAVRTTFLRVPWPNDAWLKGHAFGEARNLLVLEVETKGGIVGMGYLFSFRPGLRTIAACLEEDDPAARDRQGCDRGRRHLGRSLEEDGDLRPRRHRDDGDVGVGHRAVGRHWQAREHAVAPVVGSCEVAVAGVWLGLLPRFGRRRHDREGAALQGARLQGDQDADGAYGRSARRRRQREAHARGARPRHGDHDRHQPGLDRGRCDQPGPEDYRLRRVLARGAGAGR